MLYLLFHTNVFILVHSNAGNSSREYEQSAPSETSGGEAEPRTPAPPVDRYEDLSKILHDQLQGAGSSSVVISPHRDLNVLRPENPTIAEMEDLDAR